MDSSNIRILIVGVILLATMLNQAESVSRLFSSLPRVTFSPVDNIPRQSRAELEHRRQAIIRMARDAWHYTLKVAPQPVLDTVLPAMSTLWLMDLKHEYRQAKARLAQCYQEEKHSEQGLREGPGALLSLYVLTGDEYHLDKAEELAQQYPMPDMANPENLDRALAYWNSNRLELRYLSDLTGDEQLWTQMSGLERHLAPHLTTPGDVRRSEASLATQVKSYLQSNGYRTELANDLLRYYSTIDSYLESGYFGHYPQLNLSQVQSDPKTGAMTIRQCLYGATLGLGAAAMPRLVSSVPEARRHWQLAEALTETCHLAANQSTGYPYGEFRIDLKAPGLIKGWGKYWLEPQLAETYFVLWRLTGEEKYREYAWELARAIEAHGRTPDGRGFIKHRPMSMRGEYRSADEGRLLGATLKFLYLTLAPDELLPLDKWVFSASGQPLPICGKNSAYPRSICTA